MRSYIVTLATCAALGACTTASNDTPMSTSPEVTRETTWQDQLVKSAGLTNVPKAVANQRNAEIGSASAAGMAVTGAASGVGALSNFAAGGLGILTFLSSPPAGPESTDHMIVELSPTESPEVFAAQIQQFYLRSLDSSLRAKGYQPQLLPGAPGQKVYASPDCKTTRHGNYDRQCSYSVSFALEAKGTRAGKQVYRVQAGETNPSQGLNMNPNGMNAVIFRRAADAFPGKVSVYVAPRKQAEGWTPPMLYSRGKPWPL